MNNETPNGEIQLSTDGPKWSWFDVSLVLLILFALIPFSGIFKSFVTKLLSALGIAKSGPGLVLFLGTLLQATVMTVSVIFLTTRKGARKKDLGLTSQKPGSDALTGFSWGLLLGAGVMILGSIMSLFMGTPPPQDVEKMLQGLKEGKELWFPLIAVSILAPVSEEIYFRGMAYPVIRARFGRKAAIILSAAFFGAIHLDIYRFVPISAGGIGLAYLYEKTGSLLTPIIAHSTWNTLMLAMLYMAGNLS